MKSSPLYPYQERVSTFAEDKPRVGMFVGYGGGKTYLSLKWLEDLHNSGREVFPALVLTLPSLLTQWGDQIEEHSSFTYTLIAGAAKKRSTGFGLDANIYIANYDFLRSPKLLKLLGIAHRSWRDANDKLQQRFVPPQEVKFRTVIVDESVWLKEKRTRRFRSLYALAQKIPHRTILTGKPILERPEDIWSQMYFLDDGEALGRSFWKFRSTYFAPGPPHRPYDWVLKPFAEARIAAKLNHVCIRIPEKEVAEQLPPKRYIRIHFEMPASVRKQYEQLRKEFSADLLDGSTYETVWAVARSQKMHQLCQGVFYTGDSEYELVHTLKLACLKENIPLMLREGPVLVWTDCVRMIPLIAATLQPIPLRMYKGEGMTAQQREEAKLAFQCGEVDVLILSEQAASAGLNLQRAKHAVFFSTGHWAGKRENAEKRCHRIGSEIYDSITYYDYVVKNSLDEVILDAIKEKLDVADAILKHVRGE